LSRPSVGGPVLEVVVRHCPECRRVYRASRDVCPECWERLENGRPARGSRLWLVFETSAVYEADMLETLLQNEGIPVLKVPGHHALLWPLGAASPLVRTRLFVRADMASQAVALIAEVTGGERGDP
jgi:hypothetical protein